MRSFMAWMILYAGHITLAVGMGAWAYWADIRAWALRRRQKRVLPRMIVIARKQ